MTSGVVLTSTRSGWRFAQPPVRAPTVASDAPVSASAVNGRDIGLRTEHIIEVLLEALFVEVAEIATADVVLFGRINLHAKRIGERGLLPLGHRRFALLLVIGARDRQTAQQQRRR